MIERTEAGIFIPAEMIPGLAGALSGGIDVLTRQIDNETYASLRPALTWMRDDAQRVLDALTMEVPR